MAGCVAITRLFVGWSERSEVQQTRVDIGSAVGLRYAHSNLQKTVALKFSCILSGKDIYSAALFQNGYFRYQKIM